MSRASGLLLLSCLCALAALPAGLASPATETRAAGGGAIFEERAKETGLDFKHVNGMSGRLYMPEIMGPGAALFDADADGDLDVLLVQGGPLGPPEGTGAELPGPRLFRNDLASGPGGGRTLRFTDVTATSGLRSGGYGMGVAAGDYDGDGRVDLYITGLDSARLWRNVSEAGTGGATTLRFEDATAKAGVDNPRWAVSAAFFDYDRDGRLDLYVGNYLRFSFAGHRPCRTTAGAPDYCGPVPADALPDRLFHNRGDGTFEDVSARAGIAAERGPALGVATADFDGDGWLDVFVSNDETPNLLWINRKDGTFRNEALLAGCAVGGEGRPQASMGVDAGDFDGDGDEDLFKDNLNGEGSTLFRNDSRAGSGAFEDVTAASGLALPTWSFTGFGAAWLDYDNDGRLDLLQVNGAVKVLEGQRGKERLPLRQRKHLFRNVGVGGPGPGVRFEEMTARAGAAFELPEVSRGAAFGDVDNDGDTDVVIANNDGPARLLLNQVGAARSWLGLRLVSGRPGCDALGARVGIERAGAPTLWRRARADGSYASANDPRVLVGLGENGKVARVVVTWPSGRTEVFAAPPLGAYTVLREGEGTGAGKGVGVGEPEIRKPMDESLPRPSRPSGDSSGGPARALEDLGWEGSRLRFASRRIGGGLLCILPCARSQLPLRRSPAGRSPRPVNRIDVARNVAHPRWRTRPAGETPHGAWKLSSNRAARPAEAVELASLPPGGGQVGEGGRLGGGRVPIPDTSGMEEAVREQIEAMRRRLAEAERPGTPAAERAAAFGECGRIYLLYDLLDAARVCLTNAAALASADFRWPYYLGVLEQARGEAEAARESFAKVLALRPGDVPALLRTGEVELLAGRPEEAQRRFAEALARAPGSAAARFGLGRTALARGDAQAALADLEAALAAQPAAAVIHYHLGLAYRRLGKDDEARRHLEAFQKAGAGGRVAFADPLMEELARSNEGAKRRVAQAAAAFQAGDFAKAAEEYRKALEADPGDAAAWLNLGVTLDRLRDPAGAESSYRKSIELAPDEARTHANLGALLAAQGKREEGIAELESAVRLDPQAKRARFNLALALAEAGQPQKSLEHWDRLLELDPSDPAARFQRAKALLQTGKPAEAAEELGRVVAADPTEAEPRVEQARALLIAGRDAEARQRLEEGLQRLPGQQDLVQWLARLLAASSVAEVRDGQRAWQLAEAALASGSTAEKEETAAMALAELGRFPEAIEHQRRAITITEANGGAELSAMRERLALYERGQPARSPWR